MTQNGEEQAGENLALMGIFLELLKDNPCFT
jgi:hypothetical protein